METVLRKVGQMTNKKPPLWLISMAVGALLATMFSHRKEDGSQSRMDRYKSRIAVLEQRIRQRDEGLKKNVGRGRTLAELFEKTQASALSLEKAAEKSATKRAKLEKRIARIQKKERENEPTITVSNSDAVLLRRLDSLLASASASGGKSEAGRKFLANRQYLPENAGRKTGAGAVATKGKRTLAQKAGANERADGLHEAGSFSSKKDDSNFAGIDLHSEKEDGKLGAKDSRSGGGRGGLSRNTQNLVTTGRSSGKTEKIVAPSTGGSKLCFKDRLCGRRRANNSITSIGGYSG